jgi:hypothetical protein
VFLGSNLISWSARNTSYNVKVKYKAEYKSLANAMTEGMWVRSLLQELYVSSLRTARLWCDNIGTTYLLANPVFHARTKHIEINYHFVRSGQEATRDHVRVKQLSAATWSNQTYFSSAIVTVSTQPKT